MRKGTKIVLFTGLGILVVGLIVCVIAFALNGFSFRKAEALDNANIAEQINIQKTLTEDFSDIEIAVAACDVEIKKAASGNARVDLTYTKDSQDSEYEVIAENGTLIIRSKYSEKTVNWLDLSKIWDRINKLITHGSANLNDHLILYLEDKEYQQLDISVVTGDIAVDPDFIFKAVNLTTVTGDITVSQMKELVTLNVATTTGDIKISDTGIADSMSAAAVTGDLSFEKLIIRKKADISVTTGDISLDEVQGLEIKISSTTGDIRLISVMADVLSASTTSGDITGRIDADINVNGKATNGDVSVPAGTKGNWTIETVSGDIALQGE